MTLKEMKPGQSGQVLSIGESGPLKRRIMDMGITPGVALKVIKTAPLGDPIEINVLRAEPAERGGGPNRSSGIIKRIFF